MGICVSAKASYEKGALRRDRPFYVHFENWKEKKYYWTKLGVKITDPKRLFPASEWHRILEVSRKYGIKSRHHVYNFMMASCELHGSYKGGVVLNRYIHSLRLPRASIRRLALRIFPRFIEATVVTPEMGWHIPGSNETNRDFVRHLKLTLNFKHVNEMLVEDGFTIDERHVSKISMFAPGRRVIVKYFGFVDHNLHMPCFALCVNDQNAKKETSKMCQRDLELNEMMWNLNKDRTKVSGCAALPEYAKGLQVLHFSRFAEQVLKFATLDLAGLIEFVIKDMAADKYWAFNTIDIMRIVKFIMGEDLDRTMRIFIQKRFKLDCRGKGIQRAITFFIRYPFFVFPVLLLQQRVKQKFSRIDDGYSYSDWSASADDASQVKENNRPEKSIAFKVTHRGTSSFKKFRSKFLSRRNSQVHQEDVDVKAFADQMGTGEASINDLAESNLDIKQLVGEKGEYAKDPWVAPSSTRVAKLITAQNLMKRVLRKDDIRRLKDSKKQIPQGSSARARRRSILELKKQRRRVLSCLHCRKQGLMERSGFCTSCQQRAARMISDVGGFQFSAAMLSWAGSGDVSAFFLPRTNLREACWIREKDPGNHNRPFYYNVATGESTWERPDACDEHDDDDSWMDHSSVMTASSEEDEDGEAPSPSSIVTSKHSEGQLPSALKTDSGHHDRDGSHPASTSNNKKSLPRVSFDSSIDSMMS